uniref:TIR domain-containing protein n=1 Tax=Leptobrachium leishanense TaxID=445787 RepID=A0A8C5MUY6_9ANUR
MVYLTLVVLFSIAKLTTMAKNDLVGKNRTLECVAFIGHRKNFIEMYWIQLRHEIIFVNSCNEIIYTSCETTIEEWNTSSGLFSEIKLHLINTREDDVNYQYICKMDTHFGSDINTYSLKIKEKNPDISHKVFMTSMVVSITCSICIMLLVVSCVLLRIEIVLLYRSITGKDETIMDGKEYDAYVSYAKHSFTEEERKFALQTLPDILENYFGYRLCIFERDIVPGGSTVDEITSYIENCRRLIILLSKSYISDKAMYELENGFHKAMVERKIKVILIEFTPLKELKLMPESVQLLKASSRVKWRRDQSFAAKSRFWKKIQYLMPAKPFKHNRSQDDWCSTMKFERELSVKSQNGEIHTITLSPL